MYVSQIVMSDTLNTHTVVCQLYLNKTGGKRKKIKKLISLWNEKSKAEVVQKGKLAILGPQILN